MTGTIRIVESLIFFFTSKLVSHCWSIEARGEREMKIEEFGIMDVGRDG